MAFNTLERLEQGNVDFVYNLTSYDYNSLIKNVRKSENRISIINGFLPKLKDTKPKFCFDIIFDIDEFQDEAEYLFHKVYTFESLDLELLNTVINKCNFGPKYLEKNFEDIITKFQKNIEFILKYLFNNFNTSLQHLKKLSIHSNLKIRFQFMRHLLSNYPSSIDLFYDDIIKYLTSYTHQEYEQITFLPTLMEMEDVCKLAYLTLSNNNYELWQKFKTFILSNYKYNTLASQLLSPKRVYYNENSYNLVDDEIAHQEFNKDADTYFTTSLDYRFNILRNYSQNVSNQLLEKYKNEIKLFHSNNQADYVYRKMETYGLSRTITEHIEKYLSLSNNTTCEELEKGSTASVYRIGDYVLKLINAKWSYEDIICPNLYLILPNLEEILIRNDEGIILAGLEIQKFLKKDAKDVPKYIFTEFITELRKLGYYTTDTLIGGTCGDNCRLYDDYKDSGNLNPPEWYIDYPLALVDRDRIYQITNKYPKQLRSGY